MAEIVGTGYAVFDIMFNMDQFIVEDDKDGYGESKVQCGGPCAVGLIAASKLGVSTAYMGKVGDDPFGIVIRDQLSRYGVDLSRLTVVEDCKSLNCVVLANKSNGTRSIVSGGGWDEPRRLWTREDVDANLDFIRSAKILFLDGGNLEAATYAAKVAKEAGVKILVDTEGKLHLMDEMLHLADYIIPSLNHTQILSGVEDPWEGARILFDRYKPEALITTLGPDGGILVTKEGARGYDAFKVDVIDSNGAGDVFHGAFAAAMVKGMDCDEAVRFASAASAIKCTHFGASEGAPDYETVMKFLEERQ